MLMLSKSLMRQPVISLHSGQQLTTATGPVIDPDNLKILGWYCRYSGMEEVLLADDVREASTRGLVVNDETALTPADELVRWREILTKNFQLLGKPVKTNRRKLGKVSDYAYDDSMFIQQLYVEQPMTRIFSNHDTLLIGRNQIKEVTDTYILVNEADEEATAPAFDEANEPLPETA